MNKKVRFRIMFICTALILVFVFVYSGLRILESTVFSSRQDSEFVAKRKTITKDGIDYFPRQDIDVIMILGIDQEGKVQASSEPNHGNAVDMVTLVIVDEKAKTYSLLNINRDTMLTMPMLDDYGRENGTFYGQLAYSHTYGTGVEDSCENTKKTISNFLYGINIDYYIAMNMDAVALMNDAVGGVTVTVKDDFSLVDPTIPMGEFTLMGEQARTFVQARWYVSEHLNLNRIERQKEYMGKFAEAFFNKAETDEGFIISTYDLVSDYIVTDCSVTTFTEMFTRYAGYEISEIVSLEGDNILGEQFYEFYADEEKLDDLIIRMFYAPK